MNKPTAHQVSRTAAICTGVLFLGGIVSFGVAGMGRGGNLGAAIFGGLLWMLALASLIVWITARDVAGDAPTDRPTPSGFEPVLKEQQPKSPESHIR